MLHVVQPLTFGLVAPVVTVLRAVAPPSCGDTLGLGNTRPLKLSTTQRSHRTILPNHRSRTRLNLGAYLFFLPEVLEHLLFVHLLIRPVFAVLISITEPLLHETLLAPRTLMLGGADLLSGAALFVRVVPAVWITIAKHGRGHTLATATFKLCGAADFVRC